ncbi:hypothetical protein, partial [Klebsiella pneumoniae]|uniref:hypothetical protein n=1 Tax=Klebsiella pneumoniae TaxID=573 RepID=UPI003531AA5B
MLREVDKDEPLLHKVYEMWDVMIEQIQSIVLHVYRKVIPFIVDKKAFFARIHKILVERWDKSNTPLHCMAHALNPKYYTDKWINDAPGRVAPNLDNELSKYRRTCIERLFGDAADATIKRRALNEYTAFSVGDFSSEGADAREDEH